MTTQNILKYIMALFLTSFMGLPVMAQHTEGKTSSETAKKIRRARKFDLKTVRFQEDSQKLRNSRKRAKGRRNRNFSCKEVDTTMVLVPRGHVAMGNEAGDSLWGFNAPNRHVSVEDFLIDRTEVTNDMYRRFVQAVTDSIIAQRLANPSYGYDINKVRESMMTTNAITGHREINTSLLNYRFEQYDHAQAVRTAILAKKDSNIMISKDTAYYDADGHIILETVNRRYTGPHDFLHTYIVNVYPDTTCWVMDFPEADNDMYMRYYYAHPDYRHYPVVGVSWLQANAYCHWRTQQQRKAMGDSYGDTQPFRLPTEAEWEYAARANERQPFPWLDADKAGTGRYYANFMPDEGNYAEDGNIITAHVATYLPNAYGIYDMAGNAAEWCSTTYTVTGVKTMNNVNPQHTDANGYLKIVRGGSWKDSERFVQASWRMADERSAQHAWIGFRCAQSLATTTSGKRMLVKTRRRTSRQ